MAGKRAVAGLWSRRYSRQWAGHMRRGHQAPPGRLLNWRAVHVPGALRRPRGFVAVGGSACAAEALGPAIGAHVCRPAFDAAYEVAPAHANGASGRADAAVLMLMCVACQAVRALSSSNDSSHSNPVLIMQVLRSY